MTFLDNTGLAYFWSKLKALFATKSELETVRQSASKAYHYKGSVATVSDLPANAEQGDVYNVGATLDGDNYAWTGTAWDKLGASVDLSPYALDANVVKLSGNQTIDGQKTFKSYVYGDASEFRLANSKSGSTGQTAIYGGSGYSTGAYIALNGISQTSYPGQFYLTATDGTNYKTFRGYPNGDLKWDGKDIITNGGNQTIGGDKTFLDKVIFGNTGNAYERLVIHSVTNAVRIAAEEYGLNTHGAMLTLYGKSAPDSVAGKFTLDATSTTASKTLTGLPDGTLTWAGKGFVYDSGDQTIAGTKTFSRGVYSDSDFLVKRNFAFGTWPSSGFVPGVGSKDKNDLTGSWLGFRYDTTLTSVRLYLRKSDDTTTSATSLPYVEFAYGKNTAVYAWEPKTDNSYYLGYSSNRWKQLYASTTTISTSDERLKDNIEAVPDAVLDAWGDVDWSQFQFRDSIAEKGTDKARLHNGLVAQRIDAAFKAHGQDASRYGLFCYDEWEAKPEEKDEQGNVCEEAKPAGNIYSLRYEEALCMEAAYQRRRADRAEARITALEQRLAEMEAAIASLISPVGDETYAEPE